MAPMTKQAPKVAGKSSRAWEALTPELSEWILSAVSAMGLPRMTPVQASCIPLFMGHKDVVVEAVTGSGKTLAFLIPVVEKILRLEERTKKHHVASVIVSPTTELARQIHAVLSSLLAFHGPSMSVARANKDSEQQEMETTEDTVDPYPEKTPIALPQLLVAGQISPKEDLRKFLEHSPNVLVATPGRLLELLSSPHVHCPQSSFEMLVLDEADRLLDMGFKNDLQKIIAKLPKQRRTGLFSATVGEAVDQIVRVGLRNPVKIAVKVRGADGKEDQKTPASLQMSYMTTPASHKIPQIIRILSQLEPLPYKTIIYLSTCAAVDYWQHVLPALLPTRDDQSFTLVPLHGKQQQKIRQKNFASFVNAVNPAVLLTTDVAARGLDIPQVDVVFQIDPPSDPKAFLHRCGRAGRAGRKGLSILFLQPGREEDYLTFLEIRRTPLTQFNLGEGEVNGVELSQADNTTESIRQMVKTDRAFHEKAQRAFVSWVQSYSKHQASSIFRLQDQDWEDLARAWGLLKLPRMPELKGLDTDRSLGLSIDWDAYRYKDKAREQARQKTLLESHDEKAEGDRRLSSKKQEKRPWSDKHGGQERRVERRDKRQKRRDIEKDAKMTPAERLDQQDLNDLIAKVRMQNQRAHDEFEGFDD